MGHADEFDGIEEYDNPLPDWWLGLFWFCIIWAIGYTVHYHFIADRSPEKGLAAEMAAAAEMWPVEAAGSVTFSLSPEAIQAGEEVYDTYCFVCHGAELEGGIGPSFLDEEWLHGHTPEEVIHIISNGVVEKGMAAWGPILGAEKVNYAAAFVLANYAEALGIPLEQITEGTEDPESGGGGVSEEGQAPGS
jgi:cytochrome c oxidase cbb3-type subunit 3